MIIDKDRSPKVDMLWHGIIDVESGVLRDERYQLRNLVLVMHKNPSTRNADLVYVPYAVSLWRGKEVIAIVSIEQDDLRSLARNLGCAVRELQKEQGVKGVFGKPRVIAYAADKREDLGPYEGEIDLIGARECLLEWACDIVDVTGAPVSLP